MIGRLTFYKSRLYLEVNSIWALGQRFAETEEISNSWNRLLHKVALSKFTFPCMFSIPHEKRDPFCAHLGTVHNHRTDRMIEPFFEIDYVFPFMCVVTRTSWGSFPFHCNLCRVHRLTRIPGSPVIHGKGSFNLQFGRNLILKFLFNPNWSVSLWVKRHLTG